ncbi:hypothetical protein BJ741DRAFT_606409 [Chytriomyces cf. hyalinus JEL632]|nr:hypothetical protein BJ741DRAFT_606409 [Chytriomyces cf. hyalinus JEL632]
MTIAPFSGGHHGIAEVKPILPYGPPQSFSMMPPMPSLFTQVVAKPAEQAKKFKLSSIVKRKTVAAEMTSMPPRMPILQHKQQHTNSSHKEDNYEDNTTGASTPTRKVAFGRSNTARVTTIVPFLNTRSNLVHTTDFVHSTNAFSTLDIAAIKAKNEAYLLLSPRLIPTKHLHPIHAAPPPQSDFNVALEDGALIQDEVGVPSNLEVWVHRARKGKLHQQRNHLDALKERDLSCWGGIGVGLGDPQIGRNTIPHDSRIALLLSSHTWNGGGDVRLACNGSLLYTIHRKSVGNKDSLILRDSQGRSIWKISERIGFTGWNYDLFRATTTDAQEKQSKAHPQQQAASLFHPKYSKGNQPWHLIGTLDRASPSASTGPANSVFGTLANKRFASEKVPTYNLKHDSFCGRIGVGGVVGVTSPTGCAGDSMIQPFTRLVLNWHGWKTHAIQSDKDCTTSYAHKPRSRSIHGADESATTWESERDGVSSTVMMGDPSSRCYRFLDQKTSRHSGTFLKVSDKVAIEGEHLDRWELVIEPPFNTDGGRSERAKCVRRSMPPEMILAGSLVAQMMVDRKSRGGRLNGNRGVVEAELGTRLGRRVKKLSLANKEAVGDLDIDTISYY